MKLNPNYQSAILPSGHAFQRVGGSQVNNLAAFFIRVGFQSPQKTGSRLIDSLTSIVRGVHKFNPSCALKLAQVGKHEVLQKIVSGA